MLEFDPNHEKWQCCCCRVTAGLQIMGIVEAICASAVIPFALNQMNEHAQSGNNGNFVVFYASLAFVTLLIVITSLLMIIGIRKRKEKLLYPTIIARVLLVIFVTVFGVSIGVVRHENASDLDDIKSSSKRGKTKISGRKIAIFLMVLMMFVSMVVFYTIFLVVRGVNFLKNYNRLKRRRSSFTAIAYLDPNLMVKRPSQASSSILH
uniref:Serpentine receptor class gamma n=1 Tax=Meloidogyne floridensis TaxID=298350 RepID=A0A915NYY9_9BILA